MVISFINCFIYKQYTMCHGSPLSIKQNRGVSNPFQLPLRQSLHGNDIIICLCLDCMLNIALTAVGFVAIYMYHTVGEKVASALLSPTYHQIHQSPPTTTTKKLQLITPQVRRKKLLSRQRKNLLLGSVQRFFTIQGIKASQLHVSQPVLGLP